jgi:DNA modification methylase
MNFEDIIKAIGIEPYYRDWQSDIVIYNADCRLILPLIPDKSIDLVLTDPPYGIGAANGVGGYGVSKTDKHYIDDWDDKPIELSTLLNIVSVANAAVIFGGQFYALPINGHWIVWDKIGLVNFGNPYGDCELAWTNIQRHSVKKFTTIQQGFVSKERERWHPTQKPLELFSNILNTYSELNHSVLDPFLGSGTTAVACKTLGRKCIGIEIEPKYCDIAVKRLAQGVLI